MIYKLDNLNESQDDNGGVKERKKTRKRSKTVDPPLTYECVIKKLINQQTNMNWWINR